MKTVLSIPARMKSARLPGKVLAPIEADGETHAMLWYQVQRLRKSSAELVIATTEDPEDDAIANAAKAWGVRCIRGSSTDLIARHAKVVRETGADVFVLSGADDPLLEASVADALVTQIANGWGYAQSEGRPIGMNMWAWSGADMLEADREATDPEEREHVNPWFLRRPHRYPPSVVGWPGENLYDRYRLTVDYPEDFELIGRIIAALWPWNQEFTLPDILDLFDEHPEWAKVNAHRSTYHYDLTPVDEGVTA